jgi:hypothetical protein
MMDNAPAEEAERLRLRAVDAEDLTVLAAFLQDAIANVSEMAYLPDERRFVLAVCRFRWERAIAADGDEPFERVSCAITVEGVSEPKLRGFALKERGRTMPLLTVTYEDGAIMLTFGGNAAIRLSVDSLDLRMEDFGACWPTLQKPEHGDGVL